MKKHPMVQRALLLAMVSPLFVFVSSLPANAVICQVQEGIQSCVLVAPQDHNLNGVQADILARPVDPLCVSSKYIEASVQFVMEYDGASGVPYVQVGSYWS